MMKILPPLTDKELLELVIRCEQAINRGDACENNDVRELCERVRTFMQVKSAYQEMAAILMERRRNEN